MKKAYKRVKKLKELEQALTTELKNVSSSQYYKISGNERDKERNIKDCEYRLKDVRNKLHTALENLQLDVSKELYILNVENK